MKAVNSFAVLDLLFRLQEYNPNVIIIYAGHNTYCGSFRAASTQFGFVNNA